LKKSGEGIPGGAGIQVYGTDFRFSLRAKPFRGRLDDVWTPAFAGVTKFERPERTSGFRQKKAGPIKPCLFFLFIKVY
jgi:hypothetical protein